MSVNEAQRKTVAVKLRFRPAVAKALEELAVIREEERVAVVSELILGAYSKSTSAKKKDR